MLSSKCRTENDVGCQTWHQKKTNLLVELLGLKFEAYDSFDFHWRARCRLQSTCLFILIDRGRCGQNEVLLDKARFSIGIQDR